jgi:hypothetical protein
MSKIALVLLLLCAYSSSLFSQDSLAEGMNVSKQFLRNINKRSEQVKTEILSASQRAVRKLARYEEKLKKELQRTDSATANDVFGDITTHYKAVSDRLSNEASDAGDYIPYLDTIQTSLRFLSNNLSHISGKTANLQTLNETMTKISSLKGYLSKADNIRNYILERKAFLNKKLRNLPVGKELQKYNKEAYYYSQQLKEYKTVLSDASKAERKAIELIQKIPAVKKFFSRYSELATLFPSPDHFANMETLPGLQSRSAVQQMIQQKVSSSGPAAEQILQENIQQAGTQLDQIRQKIAAGNTAADPDMPGFKPNNQKVKSFWKRVEYGTNLQTSRNNFFPVTADIGFSIGYKLNDKSVIGFGGAYKLGLGKDIRNIAFSHQGIGLRSFLDWKLKGSFYVGGGYEQNYRENFQDLQQLDNIRKWQQSGLLGISKIVSLRSKTFKRTKVQLLWDFLSYSRHSTEQPIKFRVGYNF